MIFYALIVVFLALGALAAVSIWTIVMTDDAYTALFSAISFATAIGTMTLIGIIL